jgi:hypothetical protein
VRAFKGLGNVCVQMRNFVGLALVLVMAARFNALALHVFTVKHQHVGFLVVHPNNGVKSAHVIFFLSGG